MARVYRLVGVLVFLITAALVSGHPGKLDPQGGHYTKRGTYHFHTGPRSKNYPPPPPSQRRAPQPPSAPAPPASFTPAAWTAGLIPRPAPLAPFPEEVEEKEKRLIEWFMDRAEEGSPSAQYELGVRYLEGKGLVKNDTVGRDYLLRAAKLGDLAAYEKFKNTDYSAELWDTHGRLMHSTDARKKFMALTGFPHGRVGHVICHILPIYCGGGDVPENMRWAPIVEALLNEPWNIDAWLESGPADDF